MDVPKDVLKAYYQQTLAELSDNVLPFYIDHAVDVQHGGFLGSVANDLTVLPDAPKGLVQHSRMLWVFSLAYRRLGDTEYLKMAERAYLYLLENFLDVENGGLYWLLDFRGQPLDTRKMIYGLAFAIYGFSEYYRASANPESLSQAQALFALIERHLRDAVHGGYFEGCQADWSAYRGASVDDVPAAKTMNSHLHLLEAYTNLLRVWDDCLLRERLQQLIEVTLKRIVDVQSGHFRLHFEAQWQSLTSTISYGHDIEGSWLLMEAAEVLGVADLSARVSEIALKMAEAAYQEGREPDGTLRDTSDSDEKIWWVQAEALVGFFNAYQMTGSRRFLDASLACWRYIQAHISDPQYGGWIAGLSAAGRPLEQAKSSIWKTPYHNGRALMELMQRIDSLDAM